MIENLYYSNQFMAADTPLLEAHIVLFGCPFDGTSSYRPGSRFAANAIREASWSLETYSPALDRDLADVKFHDAGDIELPFGDTQRTLAMVRSLTAEILTSNKIPFMIGGEHLLTLPTVEACFDAYPDLQVIQFDAHCDLRDDYLGDRLSHACVARRILDFVSPDHVFQFGVRSGTRDEFGFAQKHGLQHEIDDITRIRKRIGTKPVYVTIDLDVLDPSVLPGTGTPEPGGLHFQQLVDTIYQLQALHIVGLDVVELSPQLDPTGVSNIVAAKVIRECLLAFFDLG